MLTKIGQTRSLVAVSDDKGYIISTPSNPTVPYRKLTVFNVLLIFKGQPSWLVCFLYLGGRAATYMEDELLSVLLIKVTMKS